MCVRNSSTGCLRQEYLRFKASLGYVVGLFLSLSHTPHACTQAQKQQQKCGYRFDNSLLIFLEEAVRTPFLIYEVGVSGILFGILSIFNVTDSSLPVCL